MICNVGPLNTLCFACYSCVMCCVMKNKIGDEDTHRQKIVLAYTQLYCSEFAARIKDTQNFIL